MSIVLNRKTPLVCASVTLLSPGRSASLRGHRLPLARAAVLALAATLASVASAASSIDRHGHPPTPPAHLAETHSARGHVVAASPRSAKEATASATTAKKAPEQAPAAESHHRGAKAVEVAAAPHRGEQPHTGRHAEPPAPEPKHMTRRESREAARETASRASAPREAASTRERATHEAAARTTEAARNEAPGRHGRHAAAVEVAAARPEVKPEASTRHGAATTASSHDFVAAAARNPAERHPAEKAVAEDAPAAESRSVAKEELTPHPRTRSTASALPPATTTTAHPTPPQSIMIRTAPPAAPAAHAVVQATAASVLSPTGAEVSADDQPEVQLASAAGAIRRAGNDRAELSDTTIAALTPKILPDQPLPELYNDRGRLIVPPALKGTHEILVHQNEMANQEGLLRILDDEDLAASRTRHQLVALPESDQLKIDERLPENRRYARPWTATFLTTLARAHYQRFHTPLQVNSAVRTVAFQQKLIRTNGNAAPFEGDTASPHLTGQAVDLAKKGLSTTEIAWMRGYLLPLIQQGKIDVEEEFQQSCFHISVYQKYIPASAPSRQIVTTHREGVAPLAAALNR